MTNVLTLISRPVEMITEAVSSVKNTAWKPADASAQWEGAEKNDEWEGKRKWEEAGETEPKRVKVGGEAM